MRAKMLVLAKLHVYVTEFFLFVCFKAAKQGMARLKKVLYFHLDEVKNSLPLVYKKPVLLVILGQKMSSLQKGEKRCLCKI